MLEFLVIDAGAIIRGKGYSFPSLAKIVCTVNEVISEIKDSKSRDLLSALPFTIEIMSPSEASMKAVAEFARKTGDFATLSLTDLKLIALLYTLEARVSGTDHIRLEPRGFKRPTSTTYASATPQTQTTASISSAPVAMSVTTPDGVSITKNLEEDDQSNESNDNANNAVENNAAMSVSGAVNRGDYDDEAEADSATEEESEEEGEGDGGDEEEENSQVLNAPTIALDEEYPPLRPQRASVLDHDAQFPSLADDLSARLVRAVTVSPIIDHTATATTDSSVTPILSAARGSSGSSAAAVGKSWASIAATAHSHAHSNLPHPPPLLPKRAPPLPEPTKAVTQPVVILPAPNAELESPQLSQAETSASEMSCGCIEHDHSVHSLDDLNADGTVAGTPFVTVGREAPVKSLPQQATRAAGQPQQQQQHSRILRGGGEGGGHSARSALDDDGTGWIHAGNIEIVRASGANLVGGSKSLGTSVISAEKKIDVLTACVTTDFSMQNVMMQMGLNVMSVDGMLVRQVKQWVLRCVGCYRVHMDMNRLFCSRCGGAHLSRIGASIDADTGELRLHLKKNYQNNLRGTKYSLPKPGRQGRYEGEILLREDQLLSGIWRQKTVKINKDVRSAFGPDVTSDVGIHVNKGASIKVGLGSRNPNAEKGRERRGGKKRN